MISMDDDCWPADLDYRMDGDEDSYCSKSHSRQNGVHVSDLGDMSFMMLDYIKEAMKVVG
jgi:hypothetical protein